MILQDATWVISSKTLRCNSLEDVYLLLKSSDKISRDLSSAKKNNDEENLLKPCLVMKRWEEIDPSTEFRCFVQNKELVGMLKVFCKSQIDVINYFQLFFPGICQRDISKYHAYIEHDKYNIQRDIKTLFDEKIKDHFPLNDCKYKFT